MANMTFKASLLPNTDLGYSLGSSDKRWNIYGKLQNINLNSTTIDNTEGSFTFSGSGAPWDGTDWVGLQIGDSVDKFQIHAKNGTTLEYRQNDNGGTNTSWQNWVSLLSSGNYTDYTVTKTGSGATGTWGINITGNADKDGSGNVITSTYVKKSGDTLTGKLTFNKVNNAIAYTGTQATYDMIKFKDNTGDNYGNGIIIGGGGLVVIGSGESADAIAATHSSGGDEVLDLSSDNEVNIWTNIQNGISSAKKFTFGTNGILSATGFSGPLTGNASTATKWQTGRTLSISGFAIGTSSTWDGSGNATLSLSSTETKNYSSFAVTPSANGSEWYKICTIADNVNSPVIIEIRAYAHTSVIFTASKGYSTNAGINILHYNNSNNSTYAVILGLRILSDGTIDVQFRHADTPANTLISIDIRILSATANVYPPTSLEVDPLGDRTVVQSIENLTSYATGSIIAKNFYGNLTGISSKATSDSDGNQINTTYLKRTGGSMTGTIDRTYSASNQTPFIHIDSGDYDNYIWQIGSGTSTNQYYGYGLKYIGTGSGVNNLLRLYADNQNSTDKIAIGINQNGQVGIGIDASTSYRLYVDGTGKFNDTLHLAGDKYKTNSSTGLDCHNSDISNINGIYMADNAEAFSEGLNFYRSSTTWDSVAASNGTFYFGSNHAYNDSLTGDAAIQTGTIKVNSSYPNIQGNGTGVYFSIDGNWAANKGNICIEANTLRPSADSSSNGMTLGTSAYPWGTVYGANFSGNAATADSARSLYLNGGRISSPNTSHTSADYGKMYLLIASSSMDSSGVKPKFSATGGTPGIADGFIMDYHWDNAGQYNPQLAIQNGNSSALSLRGISNDGTWSDWIPVITTKNILSGDSVGQIKAGGKNIQVNGLNAGISTGTANRLVYYSTTTNLAAMSNVRIIPNTSITPTDGVTTYQNGIRIWGTTYGNTANQLKSNTAGIMTYGDGGPQIQFGTQDAAGGQQGALIYTDHDSCGTGASWHFVSDQGDWNVNSKRFVAKTSVTIGSNLPNTSYNLHVTGTTYHTNTTTLTGNGANAPLIIKNGAGSYREGIRIIPTNNWSDITLGGNDVSEGSGTSANSWFIGNNNGNFYITRNGSSDSSTGILSNTDSGYWTLKNKAGINGKDTSYNFYVNGSSRLNGNLTMTSGSQILYTAPNQYIRWTSSTTDNNSTGCSWYGVGTYNVNEGTEESPTNRQWLNISCYWGQNLTTRGSTYLRHNNSIIANTGNTTGTVGSTTRPVYVNGGVLTQTGTTLDVSITGNAATATKLSSTPNNTTTFLRGDNTWSNTLTGTIGATNLQLSGSGEINYQGTKANYTLIKMLDNTNDNYGNGIRIGGGGLVMMGAGESASNLYSALSSPSGGSETMYLTSDGGIYFYSTCDSIANRRGFRLDNGNIIPTAVEANKDNTYNLGASGARWANAYITTTHGALDGNAASASKITQTAITASEYTNWRPIIWGASNSGTEGFTPSTITDTIYTAQTLSCQPSTGTIRAKVLRLEQDNSADPSTSSAARIDFSYGGGTGSQHVHIAYTPNDAYRAPAGLKIMGSSSSGSSPAWLEIEGQAIAGASIIAQNTANDTAGIAIELKTKSYDFGLHMGTGGENHGIYDFKASKWVILGNSSHAWSFKGNADSATKLQTARTIWGQSFNGTANITGDLIDVGTQIKLIAGQSNLNFLTSIGGAANGFFGKLGLNGSYADIDITNYTLDVNGTSRFRDVVYSPKDIGGSWIYGSHNAAFKVTTAHTGSSGSYYQAYFCGKTQSGAWSFGNVCSEDLYFCYGTDANYNAGTNTAPTIRFGCDGKVWGAVWNDYAEMRCVPEAQTEQPKIEPGRCVREVGDDTMVLSTERMQKGCKIISDTFGFNIGETEMAKTPIAVSGRALVYLYEGREEARKHIGEPVCSGPDGTVSLMTDEEYAAKGYCCVGTISAVPDYEEWGTGNVKVNGRIWIYVH